MPHRPSFPTLRALPQSAFIRGLFGTLLTFAAACSGAPPVETGVPPVVVTEAPRSDSAADSLVVAEPIAPGTAKTPPEEVADLPELDPAEAPPTPKSDPALQLAEALADYETAEARWQGGDFEGAFEALDRAYARMVEVDLSTGDVATLAQDKDNLRRLISRRLVEIYASQQTAVGDLDRSIPQVVNDEVRYEIRRFQGPERRFFLESYQRSGLYRPFIVEELRRAGMPEQLSWLPLVESGFKTRAYSSARALGLWQFISSTGARYDLERGAWVDQRMDPEASTHAALAYLTDLHGLFGDWLTALAAYNCGEGRVLRAIQRQQVSYFDHFWDVYQELPRETRRYVPRFLAVLAILDDPEIYGFELPAPMTPPATDLLQVERPLKLAALDGTLGLAAGTLAELNPELREAATPPRPYELRIPADLPAATLAQIAEVPEWKEAPPAFASHRVRRGDTLSRVASRYGASVQELVRLNRLASANRIRPGQVLRVPDRRNGGGGAPSSRNVAPAAMREIQVRVQPGDSLWILARRHGTTADRIRRDNGLSGNLLRPGQMLTVRVGPGASTQPYTVRRGDTLGGIARRHKVSLNKLLRENRLSKRSTIFPGQTLLIPR